MKALRPAISKLRALKRRIGPLWWHSGLLFILMRIGDLCSLYIAVFLVPQFVDQDKLGAVLPLTRLATFVGFPLLVVVQTSRKFLNVFVINEENGKVRQLLRDLALLSVAISAAMALYLAFATPFIQTRLKFESNAILWMVGALAILRAWRPVALATAQGLRRFYTLTVAQVGQPVVRLLIILVLLQPFQLAGYLAASVCANAFFVVLIFFVVYRSVPAAIPRESYRKHWPAMLRYVIPFGISTLALSLQQIVEPWIVRQRLPHADSAGFYIAAMFGLIPSFLAAAVRPFLFPMISEKSERKESTRGLHLQSLCIVGAVGGMVAMLLVFIGEWVLSLRPAWNLYSAYAPFMWRLGVATTLQAIVTFHVAHETACRRFGYLKYLAPILLAEVVVLYALMGWSFFEPWLPAAWWEPIARLDVKNLDFVVGAMLATRVAAVLCVGVETFRRSDY